MIFQCSYPTCQSSEPYLYYYLTDDLTNIPNDIADHIRHCPKCLSVKDQLGIMLSGSDDSHADLEAVNTTLALHFAYTAKAVTCKTVKPFLPSLLIDQLEVNVPTPITAHIKHCPACSEDLKRLGKLTLTFSQLTRLARLYAANIDNDADLCKKAQATVQAIAEMNYHGLSPDNLSHVCVCPTCRKMIGQKYKERRQFAANSDPQSYFPCDDITPADLFDYVVPFEFDPVQEDKVTFRGESLASHLRCCPACIEKMQQLHHILYSVAEHDSGIITQFELEDTPHKRSSSLSEDNYSDWPIRVIIKQNPDIKKTAAELPFLSNREPFSRHRHPLKKLASPVAASLILLILALFFFPSSAKGIDLKDLYHALARIPYVYIVNYLGNEKSPISEQWFSKPDHLRLYKNRQRSVIWDVPNHTIKTKEFNATKVSIQRVDTDTVKKMERKINTIFGLLPFDYLRDVPADISWNRITDKSLLSVVPGSEIYELEWQENTPKNILLIRKKRCYIDPNTNIIKRLESYEKEGFNSNFKLTNVELITIIKSKTFHTELQTIFD